MKKQSLKRDKKARAMYYSNPYCSKPLDHFAPFPKVYNRDEVIEYLINTNLVEWYVTKLCRKQVTDYKVQEYIQECWEQILLIKDDKLEELWYQGSPAVTAFVATIIKNNVCSNSSPAWYHVFKDNKSLIHVDTEIWDEVSSYDTYPDAIKEILINEDSKIDKWSDIN